ncbi:MAG: APC family permease, partial [Solirubrobacterales bacterium]
MRSGSALQRRVLGVPLLFAVSYSAVGFSLFFALGLVADRGLGLTPLIFLGVGIVFLLNTLTYVEGEAMLGERGGSASFARHAFNEFVSFIAGWAILIDYVIVIALAAISVPHYLTPISSEFSDADGEIITGGAVIALTAFLGIIGSTGARRQRLLSVVAVAGVLLMSAVIVVGLITSFDLGAVTRELDLFSSPSLEDVIYAGVIATAAFAGIEAAANLAPDLEFGPVDLKRLVIAATTLIPLIYAGVALVALMAVPVVPTPHGPETPLGTTYLKDPVLGVVDSFDPAWVADVMQAAVVVVAPVALIWAASTAMLGLSRHVYVLATNRQVPSWLGKLGQRS